MSHIFQKLDPVLIRLFRYIFPYKKKLSIAIIFLIGSASTSSLTATLLGKLTDLGFYHQERWVVLAAPVALIGVSILFAVCTVLTSYIMTDISQSILVTLRVTLFENILKWPSKIYNRISKFKVCK